MQVPVSEPLITDAAKQYVLAALESGWISSAGPAIERFERDFARFVGVKHAVTTSSGTTALHLALATLGIGPGDEVIVPDFTMIAPVCAVLYTGATPIFVDCDPEIYTIDVELVKQAITPRTKGIIAVHIYGHSADMDPLRALTDIHGLWLLEDAAEAHGARYKGRLCGSLGNVATFSFYGNKLVTTGEGGMLVTDDDAVASRARLLRDMAHAPGRRFTHSDLGFNYRMSNLQAACGVGQLESVELFLGKKRSMAAEYEKRLRDVAGLRLPVVRPWAFHSYWTYPVLLDETFPFSRDEFSRRLKARGVETRDFFASSASQPMVRSRVPPQGPFPVSEHISSRGVYLPSGLALTQLQIDHVCDAIVEAIH